MKHHAGKILSVALALILALGSLPAGAFAAGESPAQAETLQLISLTAQPAEEPVGEEEALLYVEIAEALEEQAQEGEPAVLEEPNGKNGKTLYVLGKPTENGNTVLQATTYKDDDSAVQVASYSEVVLVKEPAKAEKKLTVVAPKEKTSEAAQAPAAQTLDTPAAKAESAPTEKKLTVLSPKAEKASTPQKARAVVQEEAAPEAETQLEIAPPPRKKCACSGSAVRCRP